MLRGMKELKGRTAAVTGAASGIGRAIARELGARGCQLALADLDEAALEVLASELRSRGSSVHTQVLDVRDSAALERWASAVEAEVGGADILVNNAGVTVYGSFESMQAADVDWVLGVNLHAVLHGCRAFLPQLLERSGHIVNISSLAALVGLPMQTTYCASKSAVRAFSAGLRIELAPLGVGVTAILPGTVATPFMAHARSGHPRAKRWMAGRMERFGVPPERVARAVVRGIRRNRAELLVGLDARLTRLVQALAPWLSRFGLGFLYRRLAGRGGRVHPEDRIEAT